MKKKENYEDYKPSLDVQKGEHYSSKTLSRCKWTYTVFTVCLTLKKNLIVQN